MSKLVFIVLFALVFTAFATTQFEDSLDSGRFAADAFPEWSVPASRSRRVPATPQRICGPRLIFFVLSVCRESCQPQNGQDIATHCCTKSCPEDFVRKNCCPNAN